MSSDSTLTLSDKSDLRDLLAVPSSSHRVTEISGTPMHSSFVAAPTEISSNLVAARYAASDSHMGHTTRPASLQALGDVSSACAALLVSWYCLARSLSLIYELIWS